MHSLIFPAFDKVEETPMYYSLDTAACTEIALKIFKELKLQDLCRAGMTCKEWKQLIDNSSLPEEAAKLALKMAVKKKAPIQESFCIEKLGDIYLKKGVTETLLQAVGLYNYALRLSVEGHQEVLKKKLAKVQATLSKLCEGKPLDFTSMLSEFENNRQSLKSFRSKIDYRIQTLPENPSPEEVKELYYEIAKRIKTFFRHLAMQAFKTLGPAPCKYSMIGFGSLAREEMTPYSDLEFGILIQDDTIGNRKYFKYLTTLIHLKIINLGETILPALNIPCLKAIGFFDGITPRGFAFDGEGAEGKGCKTPFGNRQTFELIQTPEKMAQYLAKDEQGKCWHRKEPHLPLELLTFTHLLGNTELTEQYRQRIQENLNIPYQEGLNFTLRQYLAKCHLILEDMANFDPATDDSEREGMLFRVKNDFYRFPHLALDRLALLKEVKAADTFNRIDQLNEQKFITDSAATKLKEWMSIALFMRLKTYSHYQSQKEIMNPLIKPFKFDEPALIQKQFALDQQLLEKIRKIYSIFIPFYQIFQKFLFEDEDSFKLSDLGDDSAETQGNIALRLFQLEQAKSCFILAKNENPKNTRILNKLGIIYFKQKNLEQAAEHFKEALDIELELSEEKLPNMACLYSNLGRIYKEHGNLEQAMEYTKQALAINIKLGGEDDSHVASCYDQLGSIYLAQGNLKQAAKHAKQALATDLKYFGENSVKVAIRYNNLGQIYDAKGNLKQAAKYTKQSFAIDIQLFGENHPVVALHYNNLGQIYQKKGDLERATNYIKQALVINIKFFGENHHNVVEVYILLGQIYQKKGDLERAANYIKQALAIELGLFEKNLPVMAKIYNELGQIYHEQGNLKQAFKYTKQALAIKIKLFGENNPAVGATYNNLGMIYKERGNLEHAVKYTKQALAIDIQLFGENNPSVARDCNNLGMIYQDQKNLEQAAKYIQQSLAVCLKLFGENHPDVAKIYNNLGLIYHEQGNLGKAAEYSNKALAINLKLFGENHLDVVKNYHNLGMLYKDQENLDQALKHAKRALDIGLKLFGENNPTVAKIYHNLGMLYKDQGKLGQAAKYIKKSLAIGLKLFDENHPNVA
ncbi:tetratricopeptide repeat protein [Neochlamydia sp. TUME1]|uniref:tetratricopeptide repeat protein n=1 Tax=Neochlamydia sp. TUME1 TaxID=1478174 RepID=UPI001EE6E55A|nr:tetratricopeptide repeat protein [Neochlamydia sp. TUME1]